MYTKNVYKISEMALWTRFETLSLSLIIIAWVAAYFFLPIAWLQIPWTPMALIGTAVAFVIGFQNNAVYGRIWEARKIWGGIVNTSRTFGAFLQDMITNEHANQKLSEEELKTEIKTLTYRHIAWMTALRYAMRARKLWETTSSHKTNTEWGMKTPESTLALEEALKPYITEEELKEVLSKSNHQTALLYMQSHHLRRLKEKGVIWEFSFLELEAIIQELFSLQGKTERIKNFPYPRQYATLNKYFMWLLLLLLLLPLALVPQFLEIGQEIAKENATIGKYFVWLAVPIYLAVSWMSRTMERIGRTGENPFEGTSNDVPISTIARGIEIDLRQNLGESKEVIPAQFEEYFSIQF